MQSDNEELNDILKYSDDEITGDEGYDEDDDVIELKGTNSGMLKKSAEIIARNLVQWSTGDNKLYVPSSKTVPKLSSGVYEIKESPSMGIYFQRIEIKTEGLIKFPQTNTDKVLKEIQTFWEKEDIFKEYNIVHKRGIILWGGPGGGKTSCVQLIMKEDRKSVV